VLVPKERIHARYLYYTITINVPVVYMMRDSKSKGRTKNRYSGNFRYMSFAAAVFCIVY
jgi:hypothetical protein